MKNARKNISLSWKVRKGQQSVIPWRRQRRKERSWRNIATERRSIFSKQRKEPESPDREIYKMLEALEFNFGHKIYKVAEVGLMFAYEIGIKSGQIYVIALSRRFGTIVFYIPEETVEKIKERAQQFPYSFKDYLMFLIEFKEFEILLNRCGMSINAAAALGEALNNFGMTAQDAAGSLAEFATAYDEKVQEPAPVPNNWLKMHGLPMRRIGMGKKKK